MNKLKRNGILKEYVAKKKIKHDNDINDCKKTNYNILLSMSPQSKFDERCHKRQSLNNDFSNSGTDAMTNLNKTNMKVMSQDFVRKSNHSQGKLEENTISLLEYQETQKSLQQRSTEVVLDDNLSHSLDLPKNQTIDEKTESSKIISLDCFESTHTSFHDIDIDDDDMNNRVSDRFYYDILQPNNCEETSVPSYPDIDCDLEVNLFEDKEVDEEICEILGKDAMLTEVTCVTPVIRFDMETSFSLNQFFIDESSMSNMMNNSFLNSSRTDKDMIIDSVNSYSSSTCGMQVSPQYNVFNSSREEASSIGEASPSRSDPDIFKISSIDQCLNRNFNHDYASCSSLPSSSDETDFNNEHIFEDYITSCHNEMNIFNILSSKSRTEGNLKNENNCLFFIESVSRDHIQDKISLSDAVKDINAIEKLEALLWKLFKNIFPGVYKQAKTKTRFVKIEYLIDLIIKLTKDPNMTLSFPSFKCIFRSQVVLCKFPNECLKHIRKKVLTMLLCLLPSINWQLANVEGEKIDRLLDLVIKCNSDCKL